MINRTMLFLFTVAFICSCNSNSVNEDLAQSALIPKPVSVKASNGKYEFTDKTTIRFTEMNAELEGVAHYFAARMKPATGFDIKVERAKDSASGKQISFSIVNDKELGSEGYDLDIKENGIDISANKPAGIFMALQTILQLLPVSIESGTKAQGPFAIATGTIHDYPTYPFRGAMLDVARHFFGVEDVKRYIDLISFYKMNVLHLHLSDDQGWRIEIKSWPELTNHGGSTEVGGGKGGFYTQEQYKDIVKYAQERFITIIPEIDMPGHTNAALASYAQLNCNDSATQLYTKTEVGFSTFCVKKDITYKFIDDVVREIAAITPGPYIHLGGDESHATPKDDFIFFINKIKGIPGKYGKKMIGWEETAQANVDSASIVQFWSNAEYAKDAVKKGSQIIMSPATKVYLDMKYDSTTKLGQDWAARIEVDSSYNWKISSFVKGIPKENIMGIEAPLWTETILNMNDIEYMVFPRLAGVAELGWSPESSLNWDEYKVRLGKQGPRMKAMDIDFYKSKLVPWVE